MALLIKPQPFSTDLHRLFNSVFDDVASSSAQQRWTPAMDLVEVDDHFVLKADLPGLSEEDVSIEVNDNVLTVVGRAQVGARVARARLLSRRARVRQLPPHAHAA